VARTLEFLIKRIREELRAEGPNAVGYSDFIIIDGINAAMIDLSETFPVQDEYSFTTSDGVNSYEIDYDAVYNIIKAEYDNTILESIPIKEYLDSNSKTTGDVTKYTLWGKSFILLGAVEDSKDVNMWVTRQPNRVEEKDDTPEIPSYADEAITAYALSVCYRESRNFDKANYYYGVYIAQKSNVLRRGVPQRQKEYLPKMGDSYWGAFRPSRSTIKSDTNPGGVV